MRLTAFCAGLACILLSIAAAASAAQTHGNPVPAEPAVVHTGVNQATLPPARIDAALKNYDHWLDQLAAENRTAGLATVLCSSASVMARPVANCSFTQ